MNPVADSIELANKIRSLVKYFIELDETWNFRRRIRTYSDDPEKLASIREEIREILILGSRRLKECHNELKGSRLDDLEALIEILEIKLDSISHPDPVDGGTLGSLFSWLEANQGELESLVDQANKITLPPVATVGEEKGKPDQPGEEQSSNAAKKKTKLKIDDRLALLYKNDHEAMHKTLRQLAELLNCSPSAISETDTYRRTRKMVEADRQKRKDSYRTN